MKKLLIILLLPLCFGCKTEPTHKQNTEKRDIILTSDGVMNYITLQEVTIEGCQYFYDATYRGGALSHKGNCNNPIHNQ